uniref:ATP-dependent RNA helicase SUV3 DEXQ-box helicase domain-containing protein n=1 Tax=Aegilops tauschii subsp. strangulata TaxID=200361 RepID=A0A453LSM6_AEGTS
MAVAALLRRGALSSSCRHDVYIRCLLSDSDLHPLVNSANLNFWRGNHNSGKFDFTDMTHPHLWYPNAREKKRNVFLHVGPTNSGKTHNALKRLEASSSGTVLIYPVKLKEHTV